MAEPYSAENAEIAQEILGRALDDLLAAGLGAVESCHALVHMGIDTLPAFACKGCLEYEFGAILDAVEDRIDGLPDLVPGVDVANTRGRAH
jgi:hypothetical protein